MTLPKGISAGGKNNWASCTNAHKNAYRLNAKMWVDAIRESEPCKICGEEDPVVKEFHHVDPSEKTFNIGNCWRHWGLPMIQAEVAKCVILCANCHKRVTAGMVSVDQS